MSEGPSFAIIDAGGSSMSYIRTPLSSALPLVPVFSEAASDKQLNAEQSFVPYFVRDIEGLAL